MYIFFDFPFHCNARPTNHKTHVVLYFTLRSRSENVFFEKKIQAIRLKYSDDGGLRTFSAAFNARPELTALPESLDDYDEIYLGYPNYCGTMPMAVYTFLEHYAWQGKTIHPFCTNEGSGLSNTEQDIRRVAKGAQVARGLSLRGSEVEGAKPKLEQWLRG